MGVCANKSPHNHSAEPQQNQRIQRLVQQYMQVFSITHPLNVNHKYSNSFTLLPDKFIGSGIKKTNQYISRLSREEWLEKRKEFWESRLEWEAAQWIVIRQAVEESNEGTALELLATNDLRLINNSMQLLYDNNGHKYDVPVFMIQEPNSFPVKKSYDNNIVEEYQLAPLTIKIRSSKLPKDFELETSTSMSIAEIKQQILAQSNLVTCRFFLNGRELHDHHCVGNYQIQQGQIIQAFMS